MYIVNDRKPCHTDQDQTGPVIVDSYNELVAKTASKECKFSFALGSTLLDAASGRYCDILVPTGEPFFEGGTSFVLPRGSNFTQSMSNETLILKAQGLLPSIQEYLRTETSCRLSTSPVLTFKKLRLFFLLAYAVCFVIFLEMMLDPQTIKRRSGENDIEQGSGWVLTKTEEAVTYPAGNVSGLLSKDIAG